MADDDIPIEAFLGNITDLNGTSEDWTPPSETPLADSFLSDFTSEPDTPGPTPVEPLPDDSNIFADATTPIGDGSCIVCGAPTFRPPGLTKGGNRKRVPKYCDLHSPTMRINDTGNVSARLASDLLRVQEELADDIRLGGTLVGAMFPVTGYYLFDNADPFTIALIKLCKNNQRALRVLHRAASVAPVYEVAKCAAGVAYAVQVDQKKADPHSSISHRLGVERAYDSLYSQDTSSTPYSTSNNGFTGPPHYATQ